MHVEVTGYKKHIISSRTDTCFIFNMQDIKCWYSAMDTKTCKCCYVFIGNRRSKVITHTQGGAAGLTQWTSYFTAQTILRQKISPMKIFLFWFSTFWILHPPHFSWPGNSGLVSQRWCKSDFCFCLALQYFWHYFLSCQHTFFTRLQIPPGSLSRIFIRMT